MTISKTGILTNGHKNFFISVDSFWGRILKGRIYHECLEQGRGFDSLSDMMLILESMFDELQYPMKSLELRSFDNKSYCNHPRKAAGDGGTGKIVPGVLADFRLSVRHRFYGTWQGEISNLSKHTVFFFQSFMELMEYLDKELGGAGEAIAHGLGKKMCEVVLQSCNSSILRGDVSHPAVNQRCIFSNEFELLDGLRHMVNPLLQKPVGEKIVTPRSMTLQGQTSGSATFVVRVLFKRNATWQGTVCWKEKRRQVSFRSFMELLYLMYEAMGYSAAWERGNLAVSGESL